MFQNSFYSVLFWETLELEQVDLYMYEPLKDTLYMSLETFTEQLFTAPLGVVNGRREGIVVLTENYGIEYDLIG